MAPWITLYNNKTWCVLFRYLRRCQVCIQTFGGFIARNGSEVAKKFPNLNELTLSPTLWGLPTFKLPHRYKRPDKACTHYTHIHTKLKPSSTVPSYALLMPRLPTSTLLKAQRESPFLPLLLRECRSLNLARNELRWLRARAFADNNTASKERDPGIRHRSRCISRLRSMCRTRSRGMPLQYLLGDQPFGNVEILCERGVLIPRSAPFF